MQFDEFDKKIIEAAEHHHPAYDEQAWMKMEKMLNKHLPQKEDEDRRFIFFLLLFFGIGGAFFMIARPWKVKKAAVLTEQMVKEEKVSHGFSPMESSPKDGNDTDAENKNNEKPISTDSKQEAIDFFSKQTSGNTFINPVKGNNEKAISYLAVAPSQAGRTKEILRMTVSPEKMPGTDTPKNEKVESISSQPEIVRATNKITGDKIVESLFPANLKQDNGEKIAENKTVTDKTKERNDSLLKKDKKITKGKNKKRNFFFVSFSAGPDVSFVKSGKLGNARLLTGAGFGYTFKDRFTIRAGFYADNKIYSAMPNAYHPPPDFYIYYPYLEKVDANCKVYEIPISLSYSFGHKTNQNWFVSAGISSAIMKRETYDYSYKYTPGGATINQQWEIKNKNRHFLSGLTLSGGYQRNVNKNISLVIEPFFKLPLSGTGYGKVKLNSGGVLFSIAIKPFAKKKYQPKPNP